MTTEAFEDIAAEVKELAVAINGMLVGRCDVVATAAIALVLANYVRTSGRVVDEVLDDLGAAVESARR